MEQQQVAIVTGGSLGIGLAVCQTLCEQGYRVYNLDIRDFETPLSGATWMACDVSDCTQVSSCVERVAQQCGRIDALVSNAGVHFSATIEDTTEADLERVLAINVKGAYAAVRAALPSMKARRQGSIVLMASDQALVAKRNSFAYNLSKAALASMARTTALDYADYNIRVNAVCPGTIETPLYHAAIDNYVQKSGADAQAVHREEAALQPLGRLGQAREVAELTAFILSDKAAFMTGSLQVIDGGYTAQ